MIKKAFGKIAAGLRAAIEIARGEQALARHDRGPREAALGEALRDAADHARTMAALARGEDERLTPEETAELVAAESPIRFWRRKRGLTQEDLAKAAGMSQSALAGIESGARVGRPAGLKQIAAVLKVSVDDIIAA